MKLLAIALLSTLSLTSIASNAADYKVFAADNYPTSKLCAAAANDQLRIYRATLREYRIKEKYSSNYVTCNGEEIVDFAVKHNAMRTAKHINKYRNTNVSIIDLAKNSQPRNAMIN